MAIIKDYEIESVDINPATADASIKLNLLIVEDGTIVQSRVHRVSIPATVNLGVVANNVNASLTAAGYPTLAQLDTASIGSILVAARGNKGKTKLPRNIT